MKRFACRLTVFVLGGSVLFLFWAAFELPYILRYWVEDRWDDLKELWELAGREDE